MPKGFEKPNHTQTPNSLFAALPEIKSVSELKVILAIVRRTFGWHKESDKISLSQLEADTGLTRESVSQGVQAALEHEYIIRKPAGQGHVYKLKLVGKTDQSEKPTSQEIRPKVVKDSDQQVVGNSDPQKKATKEKKETPHSRLFKYHADRLGGKVLDGGKQGKAIKTLLANYTEAECRECYESQLAEAWRERKVSWATVLSGIGNWLDNKAHPPIPAKARIYEWQGKMYAEDEIVSDDGERYTVMGKDGTPTKRWRTPEAFALDTGRDVEKVRAGWN